MVANLEAVRRSGTRSWEAWARELPPWASYEKASGIVESARQSHPGFKSVDAGPELFKYGLAKKDCIRPSSLMGALPRTIRGRPWAGLDGTPIMEAAFLSPDHYSSATWASQMLAVSYRPQYRMELGLGWPRSRDGRFCRQSCAGGELLSLMDVYGEPNAFNRVWPAFGQPGGGFEVLLAEGASIRPAAFRLPDWRLGDRMEGVQFDDWRDLLAIAGGLQGALVEFGEAPELSQIQPEAAGERVQDAARGRVKFCAEGNGASAVLASRNSGFTVSLTNNGATFSLHAALWFDWAPLRFVNWMKLLKIDRKTLETVPGVLDSSRVLGYAARAFADLRRLAAAPASLSWGVSPLGPTTLGDV